MVGKKIKLIASGLVFVFLALTVFFGTKMTSLRFDYDFEKFFPIDDEETNYFYSHRNKFESDNDFLLIAIANKEGIFQPVFLQNVEQFRTDLEAVKHVENVIGITNHKEVLVSSFSNFQVPYIHLDSFQLEKDSSRIYRSKELVNSMVSEDGKALCFFLKHKDYISKNKCDELLEGINSTINKYNFDKVYVAGRSIGQNYYIEKMNYELILFVSLSAVLVVLFLFIAFRSVWGILLPQFVLIGTVLWILGLMVLVDQPINIILSTLPSVMFVVGMSDVIHFVSKFLDILREGVPKPEAIKHAIKEVGLATLLTSVTTAIGFFSLYFVNVEPIRAYGIVVGIGVIIAFLLTFITLPALIYLFPAPKYIEKQKDGHFWLSFLRKSFIKVIHNRVKVLIIGGIVLILGIIGLLQINANNFLMDDMKASEPLKQDFIFMDENFGGIRPFEMAITLKDKEQSFWNTSTLQKIDSLEDYLTNVYGVTIKQSLNQVLKVLNRGSHSGLPEYFKIPLKTKTVNRFRKKLELQGAEILSLVMDSTQTTIRINGGLPDAGNDNISARNVKLKQYLASNNYNDEFDIHITGTAQLLDKNMSYMASSLIKGLLVSIGIVALIMGLVYRSLAMLVISIIPNILPLLMVAGIMGYFGIELKTSTAIIFTIAFGIAVDDTIHFLGKFKHERLKGRSKLYALKRSYLMTGKAMIITTLVLCSGFLLLLFSSFLGTFNMGFLLSLTLLFALVLDLTLLPVLILIFYNPKK